MNKLIIPIIIILIVVVGIGAYFVLQGFIPSYKCGDDFCDKDAGEYPGNCFNDCGDLIANGLDKESHFGVHLGEPWKVSVLKDYVEQLGDIFVRLEILSDNFGWKQVKNNTESISLCNQCCDSGKSLCKCKPGDKYYCEPNSRDGLISDDFSLYSNFDMVVTVYASRYDDIMPKKIISNYPTNHEDIYRDYIRYLIQNLKEVKYWQIQNEIDNPQFWDGNLKEYYNLIGIAYDEIKKNCKDCKVGISFASPRASNIGIDKVCKNFDFIDLHYYEGMSVSDLEILELSGLNNWKICPNKEFISTETGIPDFDINFKLGNWELGGSEEKQAKDLIKYVTIMFNAGYSKVYWYLIDHDFSSIKDDLWEHAGLLTKDYKKKESFDSYKTMIDRVDYFTSITKLTDGQYKYSFVDKDPVYVLWCDSGTCSIPSEISGTVKVTDYLGNEETKDASEIILTESPVFVE